MENITKKELVDAIAAKASLTKKDAQAALEGAIQAVVESAKKGKKVSLIGFGSFYPYTTKATTKNNPKTRQPVQVPAKTVLKFKASKGVLEAVKK